MCVYIYIYIRIIDFMSLCLPWVEKRWKNPITPEEVVVEDPSPGAQNNLPKVINQSESPSWEVRNVGDVADVFFEKSMYSCKCMFGG